MGLLGTEVQLCPRSAPVAGGAHPRVLHRGRGAPGSAPTSARSSDPGAQSRAGQPRQGCSCSSCSERGLGWKAVEMGWNGSKPASRRPVLRGAWGHSAGGESAVLELQNIEKCFISPFSHPKRGREAAAGGPGCPAGPGWVVTSHGAGGDSPRGSRGVKQLPKDELEVKECRLFINRVCRNFLLGRNIDSLFLFKKKLFVMITESHFLLSIAIELCRRPPSIHPAPPVPLSRQHAVP